MIIKGKAVDRLLAGPAPGVRAVLFYGPDEGRVRENAVKVARSVVPDLSDPFRATQLSAADLKLDPARLADEAAALSLTGGRRVVRLRGGGEAHAELFADLLQNLIGDTLIVVEAGELAKTSRLRKLFEDSPQCAIVACYEDSATELDAMIVDHLLQHGLRLNSDARAYLLQCLGEDRSASRQELDKLVSYMGPGGGDLPGVSGIGDVSDTGGVSDGHDVVDIPDTGDIGGIDDGHDTHDGYDTGGVSGIADTGDTFDPRYPVGVKDGWGIKGPPERRVTLEDVQACIGDTTSQSLDGVCDAMAAGDLQALDRCLAKAFESGLTPVGILRAAANHLLRLQLGASMIARGSSVDTALQSLRPPVNFSRKPVLQRQLRDWTLPRLAKALEVALQGEAACKTTGAPDHSICGRSLMTLALMIRSASNTRR